MSYVQKFMRSFERVGLNRAILENDYWLLPVEDKGHEDFEPVGRGVKSSEACGKWVGVTVCKNVEGHKGLSVNGVDSTGKVVVRHKHLWCHKATCPACFIRGWSVRGARSIVGRLDEGVKREFGKVEHISVSVPPEHYDLPEKVLRAKCRLALLVRGVLGGCMIFHGFRKARNRGVLVWSPHYHCFGFILGGFDRCRRCVHERGDCRDCSGFKGQEVREYEKDRHLVKVLGERKTVFGSVWYSLHHATVKVGLRRFHAVTHFGICGNRKYGSAKPVSQDVCPVCAEEMVRCAYRGKRIIVKDIGEYGYESVFLDDEFDELGKPNYVELVGSREYG